MSIQVIKHAVMEFLIAASLPNHKGYPEAVAIETAERIILGGYYWKCKLGSNAAEIALRPLLIDCVAKSPEDLTKKFEIATIVVAVDEGRQHSKKTLDTLGSYIGTNAGQIVLLVKVNQATEQVTNISTLKL